MSNLKMLSLCAFAVLISISAAVSGSQQLSRSFEMRYFDNDTKANGETDFKGQTAVFDTDQRIDFLGKYAQYAKIFFGDPGLDTKVVTDAEVYDFLGKLKPQPIPEVRNRISPEKWKWIGYKHGQAEAQIDAIAKYDKTRGVKVKDGALYFTGKRKFEKALKPQSWRFFLQFRVKFPRAGNSHIFTLANENNAVAIAGINENGQLFYSDGTEHITAGQAAYDKWYEFKFEVDLENGRYNFYVDGQLKADFVKIHSDDVKQVNTFVVEGAGGMRIDDIWGVGYSPTGDAAYPYNIKTFIDQDFEPKTSIEDWTAPQYDDSQWRSGQLPIVHGGERYAGQDLYLRGKVHVGDFQRAQLNFETIDPGGEIWVNGQVAAVINNRHPVKIDVTDYLQKNAENLIAVRVKPFKVDRAMQHTPTDDNIGWFAGRMSLDLTPKAYVDDVFVYALDVNSPAKIHTQITLGNTDRNTFAGKAVVKFFPWYPEEDASPAAVAEFKVELRPWNSEVVTKTIAIPQPKLWTFDNPNLYKVQVILKDKDGKSIDDKIVTTGIRTISQAGGTFRINGKPEMLNGAQIMGFRMPLDKIATWNRCAPAEWLAKELLMTKKMNGNLLRIHVHAWENPARNINDPRIPEMADQMGMMLMWGTTAWIRANEAWGVDFEGYPKYMRQVYNHPSIVMWEVSNHPNRFKKHELFDSNRFYEKLVDTIYPVDPSRIISGTTFIGHTHFGNDAGTIDYKGNPIKATKAWTAPMVTRGNQDALTGYGASWSRLRKWPGAYTKDFLDSKHRAYFNFEHEESIGQPNWSLVKGKPWYRMQSYEWKYDEGSIGRKLTANQWIESQAWQGFSAYESTKKQRLLDYDGFSWCCLHGGPNTGVYKKPLIDNLGHAKIAWYTNKMVFQRILAGSDNVDVVYGPGDMVTPVIMNLGDAAKVDLEVKIKSIDGQIIERKIYRNITLAGGRTVTRLEPFRPGVKSNGCYAIEYTVTEPNNG